MCHCRSRTTNDQITTSEQETTQISCQHKSIIKTIIGIKKITVLNEKEFSIEPQEKENLFFKIMTLLKTKNIEVDGILQHRGKAEEVFRELTLNPK